MKAVILAGGLGTRISEETHLQPKPMVEGHRQNAEPWRVTLVDTGEKTNTGCRLKRVASDLNDWSFCVTEIPELRLQD